jgi:uncharacterized protein
MRISLWLAFGLLLVLSIGCAAAPTPAPTPTLPPPTAIPAEPTAVASSGPTPTVHPAILDATLPELAKRQYPGSEITTVRVLTATDTYTDTLVTYVSDGLKISGVLTEPAGQGPFPGVVLAHGYFDPGQYTSGIATEPLAHFLAEKGYVAFAPDFRGYAESDHGSNLYLSGYIIDVLNAGSSLKKLKNVDAAHVGLLGHSMGAGIAARAMVVSSVFRAFVLYSPISSDNAELMLDPLGGETVGVDTDIARSLLQSVNDENLLNALSPKNYYDQVNAPVSIHSGTQDQVTPTAWAEAIYRGLKKAGKNVEFFQYPGEGHVFTGVQENVFDARLLNFLDHNLKK